MRATGLSEADRNKAGANNRSLPSIARPSLLPRLDRKHSKIFVHPLAMSVAPESGQNRIMIYGPRNDGTYIVEFKTADGEALAINVPVGETRVLKHFQEHMPYGLFVPDVP